MATRGVPSRIQSQAKGRKTQELLTGNEAAAWGVRLSRPEIIPTYPITPQTSLLHKIASDIRSGVLKADFINTESDYSAMAAAIGASLGGARVFTATNSQGLALMSEHLYYASGMRLPIVMAVVNRALSAPHSRFPDHNDALSVNRSGWIQLFCEDPQEVLDTCIQLFKVCEDPRVCLPGMFCYEAYDISHTAEGVSLPEPEAVDLFLGRRKLPSLLDPGIPRSLNPPTPPDLYTEFKHAQSEAMETALQVIQEVGQAYAATFQGPERGLYEAIPGECGQCVIVTMGSIARTVRRSVAELQKEGLKVSLLKVRAYRPFPFQAFRELLRWAKVVLAMDRNYSPGSGGALWGEIRSSLYGLPKPPRVFGVIAGLGGRDVTIRELKDLAKKALKGEAPFLDENRIYWLGLDEKRIKAFTPQAPIPPKAAT